MARYSREAMKRSVAAGYAPPIACAACGQRFWTEQQKREHYGISADKSYCQYTHGGAEAVSDQHIASVVNDYRAAFSWAARCSCGWEELHSLAIVADRAVENHMREMEDDHD